MVLVSTPFVVAAYVVLALAAVVGVAAIVAFADFVVTNRRQRLAAHDTFGHYYAGLIVAR